MTNQDYEKIAMVFRKESENLSRLLSFRASRKGGTLSSFNDGQLQELRTLISQMAFWFGQSDKNFDKDKFYRDCLGVEAV